MRTLTVSASESGPGPGVVYDADGTTTKLIIIKKQSFVKEPFWDTGRPRGPVRMLRLPCIYHRAPDRDPRARPGHPLAGVVEMVIPTTGQVAVFLETNIGHREYRPFFLQILFEMISNTQNCVWRNHPMMHQETTPAPASISTRPARGASREEARNAHSCTCVVVHRGGASGTC